MGDGGLSNGLFDLPPCSRPPELTPRAVNLGFTLVAVTSLWCVNFGFRVTQSSHGSPSCGQLHPRDFQNRFPANSCNQLMQSTRLVDSGSQLRSTQGVIFNFGKQLAWSTRAVNFNSGRQLQFWQLARSVSFDLEPAQEVRQLFKEKSVPL